MRALIIMRPLIIRKLIMVENPDFKLLVKIASSNSNIFEIIFALAKIKRNKKQAILNK